MKHLLVQILHSRVGSWPYHKHQTRPAILAWDKHSSLLRKSVNHGQKKFYNIGPRSDISPCVTPLKRQAPSLAKIRLRLRRLNLTNTLAYYGTELMKAFKRFTEQAIPSLKALNNDHTPPFMVLGQIQGQENKTFYNCKNISSAVL